MKRPPIYWKKGKKILSKRDPVLRKIIKKYNKGFLTTKNKPFLYFFIIFLITGSLLDKIFFPLYQYTGGVFIVVWEE